MADAAYVKSRQIDEMENRLNRFLGDLSQSHKVISSTVMRETLLTGYLELLHDLGFDPRTEMDAAGTEEWTFAAVAGNFQSTEIHSKEPVAFGEAYHDQSNTPMRKESRWVLERRIANDQRSPGQVQRGTPKHWAVKTYYDQANARMAYRFLFYPAADRAMNLYFPHTIVDPGILDSATQSVMLSYIEEQAWMRRAAAELVAGLSPEDKARLKKLDPWAENCGLRAEADVERAVAKRERGHLVGHVVEYNA